MASSRRGFSRIVAQLEALHGKPAKPIPRNPFQWVLWENVAYLVDDERRARAYRALAKATGPTAARIRDAPTKVLRAVAELGGMHPEARVDKLRGIAELALAEERPDLTHLLRQPTAKARRVLRRFPGIGAPGADRILLACGALDELAVESNGLRVLVRLGYGEEGPRYDRTYRSALAAVAPELPREPARLLLAHDLLRTHGRTVCRNSAPDCDACPLAPRCAFFAREG